MKIFASHFICKGSKSVTQGLRVRGSWRPNITEIFWPQNLWPSMLCLSRSLMLNRRSRGHSAGWWLSLRHLISIFSGPQPIRAQRPLRPDVGFPYHISSITPSDLQLNWLQLNCLDFRLWNRMFNRHQAEITVMQFTGHSLPVLQSMSVPWEFF